MARRTVSLISLFLLSLAGAPGAVSAGAGEPRPEPAAPPGAADLGGLAQLARAAYSGDETRVAALLGAGVSADTVMETCKGTKGPIVYAAQKGNAGIVAMLLESGLDVNARYAHAWTALMFVAGHGDDVPPAKGVEMAELLLDRGADANLTNDFGRTALMIAAQNNRVEIVSLLLARGADPRVMDIQDESAIDLTHDARVADELLRAMEAAAPGTDY